MLKVGIAGIGFMGMIHYLAWQKVAGAKVTAISTRDEKKLEGDWRSIKGNFGPPGEQMDLTRIRCYAELDQLLADPDVDLVDVCLPPHCHSEVTVAALAAGKHVLCEKPIALDSQTADKMIRAGEASGRQLLVAQVLPFMGEFATACKLIAGGKYGRLLGGHFKRIISEPSWIPDFYDPARVGGPMVDLHIHDAHFIRLIARHAAGRVYHWPAAGRRGRAIHLAIPIRRSAAGHHGHQRRHWPAGPVFHPWFRNPSGAGNAGVRFRRRRRSGPGQYSPDPVYGRWQRQPAGGRFERSGRGFRGRAGRSRSTQFDTGRPSPLLDGGLARDALLLCEKQTASLASGQLVQI